MEELGEEEEEQQEGWGEVEGGLEEEERGC